MSQTIKLKSPLFTAWSEQYVRLWVQTGDPRTPPKLTVNGASADFQYTGEISSKGTEIMVRLGFAEDEAKTLVFEPAKRSRTDLTRKEISLARGARIGAKGREIRIPAAAVKGQEVAGPFRSVAGYPMKSSMRCTTALEGASLARINDGPLFADYELAYRFAENRKYVLRFRCYKRDSYVEVAERFSLGMDSGLVWTINPRGAFDSILTHWGPEFEGEPQPVVQPLAMERQADVLCRLQMPVLSEYFVPNNRGYFSFFDSRSEDKGMVGILGLYGDKWQMPVENMPEVRVRGGLAEWNAALASGARYWLIYVGPVEKDYTPERRFVFHRLQAEFNGLRLDEHLDLTGDDVYDGSCWDAPCFFAEKDFHEMARKRCEVHPALQKAMKELDPWSKNNAGGHSVSFTALINPTPENQKAAYDYLIVRFEKWVHQFQGYRVGAHDYMKNVIGFTRWLRGMMIAYELLRKDRCLTDQQVRRLNAYFVFAARRITDEGRWPHSRTWLHSDHPESSKDVYKYGGEHMPDRLVWTNCLPNFQSDPMCALAQLSAVFPEHPDAPAWRRKALDDIDRQLTAYCGKSGAWEESINYALYTFSYFIITFRALKQRLGIDYFQDERVRRFAAWLCRFFGPLDKRVNAYTWPGIGNAVVPSLGGQYMLAYASELAEDDPLRADCMAIYEKQADQVVMGEYYAQVLAAMAPVARRPYPLCRAGSEHMDEIGVAMRHEHLSPKESYLFQKIGFWKDHYEGDETSFNWYAKGTPLTMDYGTYTGDAGVYAAHNLVEITDADPLRRGYLADHQFSPILDYTHCELPVVMKLLWGRVRSFAEIDGKDGKVDRMQTPYFYIGDKNPVGPKVWQVRLMLFVKPDYIALFDRVYGDVPHRYNLHVTGDAPVREGNQVSSRGRFDLDLKVLVQYPLEFELETGELVPGPDRYGRGADNPHRQNWFRLYNKNDGFYRTLLFAQERGRQVTLERVGQAGMKVTTPEYTDYIFLHNEPVEERLADVSFNGSVGWIRRTASGQVQAMVRDGDLIGAFGTRLEGRGPWLYNVDGKGSVQLAGGPPRAVRVERQ